MKRTGRWVVTLTENERGAVVEALDFMDLNAGLTPAGRRAMNKVANEAMEEMK